MERKNHWDKVYTNNKVSNVSWYQREPTISLALIEEYGVKKDSAIIDVGGGASALVDNLLERGYNNIWMNDISKIPLDIAKNRLAEKAGMVNWIVGDITQMEFPTKIDLWHDRAVFHFLTDGDDRWNYIAVLEKSVKPGGHIIISTFAIDGPTKCSGLEIVQYDSRKLINALGKSFELIEEREEIHITPTGGEQKFAYFNLVRL